MKLSILTIFLITLFVSAFSQTDTLSSMDILYKESQNKTKEYKASQRNNGLSFFGGLGGGGNNVRSGLAGGGSLRVHYNFHTINMYLSNAKKAEEIYSKDYTNILNSTCLGLTYGFGAYGKYCSASFGVGVGYSATSIVSDQDIMKRTTTNYNEFGACFGGQLSFHSQWVGFGIQTYVNKSASILNYTILAGLELHVRD